MIAIIIIAGCDEGSDPVRPQNLPPVIESLTVQYNTLEWGGTTRLWVTASDPEESDLTYSWTATGGLFTSATNINSVRWQAPDSSGGFAITVTVSDDANSVSASDTITIVDNPVLSITEDQLLFNALTDTLTFRLRNTRTGVLDWTITTRTDDGGSWLNLVSDAEGSTRGGESEEMLLAVNRTDLAGGNYAGWVKATSNGGADSARVILIVAELSVSLESLDFGNDHSSLNFRISNVGVGNLKWHANDDEDWLLVAPDSGLITTIPVDVFVAVDRTGITGNFNAPITITSNGGNATVNVHMSVTPVLTISPPGDINFRGDDTRTITITNTGIGVLDWEVESGEAWLTVDPAAGSAAEDESDQVTLTVDRTGLENGNYHTEISVSSNGGDENIFLTMDVGPVITLNTDTLEFDSTFTERTFTIQNTGTGTMNWTITEDEEWLSLAPLSGSSSGEINTVIATVDRENSEVGRYTGEIMIDNGAGGQEYLPVNFIVPEGITLSYDDGSAERGFSSLVNITEPFWLLVRFTKPEGWDATFLRAVRIHIHIDGSNRAFDIAGVDGSDAVVDANGNTQYIPPNTTPTTYLSDVSQDRGWYTYEVENTFNSEQFMVGVYFASAALIPDFGFDTNGQISLRSTWRNVAGNIRQYITDANWMIRIYVAPEADNENVQGMWLDATGIIADPHPAPTGNSPYGISIDDLPDGVIIGK